MSKFCEKGEAKDAVSKCQSTYNFILTDASGAEIGIWGIDLKNGNGKVSKGAIENADATFTMTEEN